MAPPFTHAVAVFASAKGPGDAERTSLMSQAGTTLTRRNLRIVCLAEGAAVPVPLITSARAAGGEVTIVAGPEFDMPPALEDLNVEVLTDREARWQRVADLSDAFIGLPGSLVSASDLFNSWLQAGGGSSGKPVALLNRNRAFEVVRGYFVDVLSHRLANADRLLVISESMEDLWSRLQRVMAT